MLLLGGAAVLAACSTGSAPQTDAGGQPLPQVYRINKDAQLMLNIMPLPTQFDRSLTGGNYNFEWQDSCEIPKMLNALKTDYHPTEKDHFALLMRRWRADTRAYGCRSLGYGDNLPLWKHHYRYITDSGVMTWTRLISPTRALWKPILLC